MTPPSPSHSIQRSARAGAHARRRQQSTRLTWRVAPYASALACLLALLAATFSAPRLTGLAILVALAVGLTTFALVLRRARPLADEEVAELDRAAQLDGALRSAHWFAAAGTDTQQADRPDAPWIGFHLETAAARGETVDWSSTYPAPVRRGAVALTAALSLATLLAAVWPEAVRATLVIEGANETAAAEADASAIPANLLPQLVEGMRAIKAGRPASAEALAAIGQALEIAKHDDALREELDRLFRAAGEYGDGPVGFDESREGYEMRALAEQQGYDMDPSLQWAYQDAAARATTAEKGAPKDAATDPTAGGESTEGASEEIASAEAGLGAPSEAAEAGGNEGQVASFSSLLFGKQPSGGDGKAAPPAAQSNAAALMAALQREVVNAQRDVAGSGDGKGDRRTTNSTSARPNTVSGSIATTYERARATRPPAIPEARRPLVHDFFVRPADTGATGTRP